MNREEILEKTAEFAFSSCSSFDPGHDKDHLLRVKRLSLEIASSYFCDTFLVEMLAYLHDVEDDKFESHSKVGDFLSHLDIEEEIKTKILSLLPFMSFHKYPTLPRDFPIEGKIVVDADRLDALGAVGVARAFSYGGSKGRKMYGASDSTLAHFEEKLLHLDQYLHLDASKEMAKERMDYLKSFYARFKEEIHDGN